MLDLTVVQPALDPSGEELVHEILHGSLPTTKRKGVSDETLAKSIKRSINKVPDNGGKEGSKEGGSKGEREREDPSPS
jgi:hypothetical protein